MGCGEGLELGWKVRPHYLTCMDKPRCSIGDIYKHFSSIFLYVVSISLRPRWWDPNTRDTTRDLHGITVVFPLLVSGIAVSFVRLNKSAWGKLVAFGAGFQRLCFGSCYCFCFSLLLFTFAFVYFLCCLFLFVYFLLFIFVFIFFVYFYFLLFIVVYFICCLLLFLFIVFMYSFAIYFITCLFFGVFSIYYLFLFLHGSGFIYLSIYSYFL